MLVAWVLSELSLDGHQLTVEFTLLKWGVASECHTFRVTENSYQQTSLNPETSNCLKPDSRLPHTTGVSPSNQGVRFHWKTANRSPPRKPHITASNKARKVQVVFVPSQPDTGGVVIGSVE